MSEDPFSTYVKALIEFEESVKKLKMETSEDGKKLLLLVDQLLQELRSSAEQFEAKIEEDIKNEVQAEIEKIRREAEDQRQKELKKINEQANKNFEKAVEEVLKDIKYYLKSL
ncbi:MAG: hypothetical protein OWQ54_07375 [Sulfolobaceae archaeon]|nr:hypothetical protein [Sulfolobaceae archaeon]